MEGSAKLGTVKNNGIDEDGHEQLSCLEAVADCPKCGAEIELWADTDEWIEQDPGVWVHNGYGPAMGVCKPCGKVIVDYWESCFVYDLPKKDAKGDTVVEGRPVKG